MSLANGEPLLVRGIHDSNRPASTWCSVITDIILNEWPSRDSHGRTREAEQGLGIEGSPYYFYVLRTERMYGTAVFLFRDTEEHEWPKDMKGAAPFDTGDLWHDDLFTLPQIYANEKRNVFRRYETPLIDWRVAFRTYIKSNYSDLKKYISGDPPKVGSAPIIPHNPPNRGPAWTWEVRIQNEFIDSKIRLLRGFISDQDRSAYATWLSHESDLDSQRHKVVLSRLKKYVESVPSGDNASVAAELQMLGANKQ